jgi:hypothetical protein
VKRLFVLTAGLAVAVALTAAWLPFQLDAPKRTNPVDPLNPDNLNRVYAFVTMQPTPIPVATSTPVPTPCPGCTPTPAPTPCGACTPTPTPCVGCAPAVIHSRPANGETVQIPYLFQTQKIYDDNAGRVELLFVFNQDMDLSTFSAPMAVSISPAVSFSVGWVDLRSLVVYLSYNSIYSVDNPLRFNTTYTVNLGSSIKSLQGQPLAPMSTSFTTGSFRFVAFFGGAHPQGMFGPGYSTSSRVFFNGPLNHSIPLGGKIISTPDVINSMAYAGTNSVAMTLCNGLVPSTNYTFTYTGGVTNIDGDVAAAVPAQSFLSQPFKVTNMYLNTGVVYVGFGYPVEVASVGPAISMTPNDPVTVNVSNSDCSGFATVQRVGSFVSGTSYTITVGTGVRSLAGGVNLTDPQAFSFIAP